MVNRVHIIGRLTRDPEVHEGASGARISNLRVVTSEYRKSEDGQRHEDVQYHSVVAFGRLGEICASFLRRGRLVYFEGKLRTREWDGRDGLHRYTTEIIADGMKMLSPRSPEDPVETPEEVAPEEDRLLVAAGA